MGKHPDTNLNLPGEVSTRGSLRNTFLWAILPISITFILLIGGLTYLRARIAIRNQVHTQLSANLDSLEADINTWVSIRHIRLDLAVRQPEFNTALAGILGPRDIPFSQPAENRNTILELLQEGTQRGGGILFNHFMITDADGIIVIASQPGWEGVNISNIDFHKILFTSIGSMVVYNQEPVAGKNAAIVTSVPVFNDLNQLRATVFAITGPVSMITLLEDVNRFNPFAQSYLITKSQDFIRIDPYQQAIAFARPSLKQRQTYLPKVERLSLGLSPQGEGIISSTGFDGNPVIAKYTWLNSLKAALVVEIPNEIAFGELNAIGIYTLGITILFGILLSVAIGATTQRLVSPLRFLTSATQQFARGKWDQRAPIVHDDEIGLLSRAFNQMADDLAGLYHSLESQVAERTQSLEKRSQQLEATAEVAQEAASIHKLDELLTYVTRLISEKFGFYHAGIFMIDRRRKYAVLQAANSEGGQRMLAHGHKLSVGHVGVVGYVAATGIPRIALDVGKDAYFFDNPELPKTRSEMALPLVVRDSVIGVLDVQSTEPSAFEESDVETLQILADQVALAIDNTRLLENSQEVIRELQGAYRDQTRQGWSQWTDNKAKTYYFDGIRIAPTYDSPKKGLEEISPEKSNIQNTKDGSVLSVPLKLRDQMIGSIVLRRDPGENPWNPADLSLLNDAINQVTVALDNARLLEETRRTAAREQLIGDLTAKIRETLEIETVAKTAAEEIRKALELSEVSIRLEGTMPTRDPGEQ